MSPAVKWRRREYNKEADFLANWAMDNRTDFEYRGRWKMQDIADRNVNLMAWSDGGSREEEDISASAWILK
eukprot:5652064-Karenia_brevis.AAC.1